MKIIENIIIAITTILTMIIFIAIAITTALIIVYPIKYILG